MSLANFNITEKIRNIRINAEKKNAIEKMDREKKYIKKFNKALDKIYKKIVYHIEKNKFKIIDKNTMEIKFYFNNIFSDVPGLIVENYCCGSYIKKLNTYQKIFCKKDWDIYAINYFHNKYPETNIIKSIKLTDHNSSCFNDIEAYCGYDVNVIVSEK